MQTRVTKLPVVSKGKNHENDYIASWLFEAWENGVSQSDTPVIIETIKHDFFKYPDGQTDEYDKQQERIDEHLEEQAKELIEAYLNERDLTANEKRLDDAATDLKTIIDANYSAK